MLQVFETADPAYDWAAHYARIRARIAARAVKPEPAPEPEPPPPPPEPAVEPDAIAAFMARQPGSVVRRIIADIAREHGVTPAEMMAKRRSWKVSHARQHAMWRIRMEVRWSLPQIGRYFGCDHTTALHGINACARRLVEQAAAARSPQ